MADTSAATPLAVVRRETWLPLAEAARLESITDREVRNRIDAGLYLAQDSGQRAPNGKPIRQIALSSLSESAQAKHLAQLRDVADGIAAPLPAIPAAAPVLPERRPRGAAVPVLPDGTVDADALRAAGRSAEADTYATRSAAVARVLTARASAPAGRKGTALAAVAVELATPPETLRNWLKAWQREGPAGLVPGYGATRGLYKSMPQGLQDAISASYRTQQRQTAAQIWQHTVKPWCQIHKQALPSQHTVGRFLRQEILALERTAFRLGKRAYDEEHMVKVVRDIRALRPSQIFCADHRRFDVFVLSADGHRIVRPWLTLFVDLASARFAGWAIRERPNGQTVALALHHAISMCGVPEVLYWDNGKDFASLRFGPGDSWRLADPRDADLADARRWPAIPPPSLQGETGQNMLITLGVQRVIHALPYSSWSKPIESLFWAFHRAWENILPGYCGGSADAKPEKLKREIREHRLLTWDQFLAEFQRQEEDWDLHHRCGDRPKTPAEYYEAAGPYLRRPHPASLDSLLVKHEQHTISTQGVCIAGRHYMSDDLVLFTGERCTVYYDPDNLASILCRPHRNPNLRYVVPEVPLASYTEIGLAHERVRHMRKLQRQHLTAVRAQDAAARVPDYVDPTGANRLALDNAAAYKAAQIEAAAPEHRSVIAELKAAQHADEAESTARETARRQAAASVAADILAAARANESHATGGA